MTEPNPAQWCLQRWHRVLRGELDLLADLIADDAVLHSPVLFRPLPGKATVIRYLTAASMSFSPPAGTLPMTSPVPALCTSIVSFEAGAIH